MLLPIERKERIRSLIQSKQNMKISELSQELNVSEMTIHRDLKPLVEEGIVIKTFGGVTYVRQDPSIKIEEGECVYCSRKIHERLVYRLILPNNKIEVACCSHCGILRHQQLGDEVVQAICYDFLRHTTISAPLTWFVMDTSLNIGCCQPQVLTFEIKEQAEKFVKGFGGKIYSFEEVMKNLPYQMKSNYSPCCQPSTN